MLNEYKPPDSATFNFRVGAIRDESCALILAGLEKLESEDVAHTVLLLWQKDKPWLGKLLNWSSGSVSFVSEPNRKFVAIGEAGGFCTVEGSAFLEGQASATTLSAVNTVTGFGYAVGTNGTVLRYEGGNTWRALGSKHLTGHHFEAIAGFSSQEIYVAGRNGSLCLLSNDEAKNLNSPTNLILTSVCAAGDGYVYACGQRGVILRGRQHEWFIIDHGDTTENLWDIHFFRGQIFVASVRSLYELSEGRLKRVRFLDDGPISFYRLSSLSDKLLLSVGKEDVFTYDGIEWTRII